MQSDTAHLSTPGDPGLVGPATKPVATISDRRRAAHRELVKQGTLHQDNVRTGRRKRARVEQDEAAGGGSHNAQSEAEENEATGSTSATQLEGDELEFDIDDNYFNGCQDSRDEPEPPIRQPDLRLSHTPPRPPSPPDAVRNEGSGNLPQQNLDQLTQIIVDIDAIERFAVLPKQKDAIAFIRALQHASLDDPCAKLNDAALHQPLKIEDPALRHAITTYFTLEHSANEAYERIRKSAARCFEGAADVPSHARIERLIAEYTGVESIEHDMCPESCVAFTGPFAELEHCPICGTERYDPIKLRASGGRTYVARQKFITIPLGTQLQALWPDPEHAQKMSYLSDKTEHLMNELRTNGGVFNEIDDFVMGTDYIHAVQRGDITKDDVVLMISMDGAQLYESKQSDCWIYIWIVMNHAPGDRYKKKYVLPGGFIPGPNKPKNVDSFLFPGLVYFDGMVGHSGRNGCRLYCGLIGRRKGTHYYPALLIPNDYRIPGSNHPDVSVYDLPNAASVEYPANLQKLVAAPNRTQYHRLRTETGLTKPSLLLGLLPRYTLGIPHCLTPDIMHLAQLLADLLLSLWRGIIDYTTPDHPSTWEWAVFRDANLWQAHGQSVADAAQHLPSSFDRKPRNPAQKINTGYKTWEFQMYIFGLGPALLYNIIPRQYWLNYCRLVRSFRLICQHSISIQELQAAHACFIQWEIDFEILYYQRRAERLHFIRPCVHQVTHLATETLQKGPPICYSQWTMERTIGNLGQEIRQPSNPYANLSREGVRRCQVNALKAMVPDLVEPKQDLPQGAVDLGDGYTLLRKRDPYDVRPEGGAAQAIQEYLGADVKIRRWAHLRLPNGQTARTVWRETQKPAEKLVLDGEICLAEVLYFTRLAVADGYGEDGEQNFRWQAVALVSMYSHPDRDLLELSFHAVSSCKPVEDDIRVVDAKSITDVIGMVPHRPELPSGVTEDRYFLVEKPGLDIATFGVTYEGPAEAGDDDEAQDNGD
ncbi:hypothetical protein F4604DRAFT_2023567 [Suillus subluteus]|nr:hypothetical protein F4604DRAFT_2023567 [Suillus subluteus]